MAEEFELSTKAKLLKAAITVFSNHGLAGGSIRQIAELSGTNIAAVTYHYKSKRELWQEVVIHLQQRLVEALFKDQPQWAQMTPYERVKNTTRNYVYFCAQHPELHRIVLFETIQGGEMIEWLNKERMSLFHNKSLDWTALAQEEGIYTSEVSALHMYFITTSAAQSIFLLAPQLKDIYDIDVFEDEQVNKFAEAIVTLFLQKRPVSADIAHTSGAPTSEQLLGAEAKLQDATLSS
ncbi:MAG: TetR/AcrR family transcriptional regulator [Erythrobacter sp.]